MLPTSSQVKLILDEKLVPSNIKRVSLGVAPSPDTAYKLPELSNDIPENFIPVFPMPVPIPVVTSIVPKALVEPSL